VVSLELNCENVLYSRENFRLVADCRFNNGLYIITGKIGSGKSTFAKLLSGYISPDNGAIKKDGISSTMLSLQFPEFHFTESTPEEEVSTWGISDPYLLEKAGLVDKSRCYLHSLSRGEQKRLQIYLTIAVRSDLLILDEPFSTLDRQEIEKISAILSVREGITILFCHTCPDTLKNAAFWNIDKGVIKKAGIIPKVEEINHSQNVQEKTSNKSHPGIYEGFFKIDDLRLGIVASLLLSAAAYLSLSGAAAALIWWFIMGGPKAIFKKGREIFSLLLLLIIISCLMAFTSADWFSYLVRTSTVIIIAISLFSEVKPNEFRLAIGSMIRCRFGFELGIVAELMHQSLIRLNSDWADTMFALFLKGRKKGVKLLIPAVVTIIVRAMRRAHTQAVLLAIRGYKGEGTVCPQPPPPTRDIIAVSAAVIPLILAIIKPGAGFII